MKKLIRFFFLPTILFSFFCSCKDDKIDSGTEVIDQEYTQSKWVYDKMKQNYLWYDEFPEFSLLPTALKTDPELLFHNLISENETKYRFDTEGNIIGKYYYSYMEDNKDYTKAQDGYVMTYGIDYMLYRIDSNNPNVYVARVILVQKDSPAEKAGIERGMWICGIDGSQINNNNYKKLESGSKTIWSIYNGDLPLEEPNLELEIDAAQNISNNPIICSTIIDEFPPYKVGYVMYNHFTPGPEGFKDNTWNDELTGIFKDFRNNGITDLVIDLRYNLGGYLSCARHLASLIIKDDKLNDVFCYLKYSDKRSSENSYYRFDNKLKGSNANLTNVYFLTSEWTASASEAVMNGLSASGIMSNVIQIGETTEGKNLASEEIKDNNYKYILHPIIASISNKDDFGDYFNGIDPLDKNRIDEFDTKLYPEKFYPLGNSQEHLLFHALKQIGCDIKKIDTDIYKNESTKSQTNILINDPVYNSLNNRRVKGMIINE